MRSHRPTGGASIIGHIVWAADGRTLGFTLGTVTDQRVPDFPGERPPARSDRRITDVALHALETEAPGNDLRTDRVLFRPPPDATLTHAVMNADGRTGYGAMLRDDPPRTVHFTFDADGRLHVTSTFPREPKVTALYAVSDRRPRHACLNGLDAFGRTDDGSFGGGHALYGLLPCGSADAH